MASQLRAGFVLINAASIRQEIFVNGEASFNGSVGHNFSLNGGLSGWNAVRGLELSDILVERVWVPRLAGFLAFWSGAGFRAGLVSSLAMVVAIWEGVGLAGGFIAVAGTGDESVGFHVVPSGSGETSVAAHTAGLQIN